MKTLKKSKKQRGKTMPVFDEKLSKYELLRLKGGEDPPPPPPTPPRPGS